jgi:hypothetical protein
LLVLQRSRGSTPQESYSGRCHRTATVARRFNGAAAHTAGESRRAARVRRLGTGSASTEPAGEYGKVTTLSGRKRRCFPRSCGSPQESRRARAVSSNPCCATPCRFNGAAVSYRRKEAMRAVNDTAVAMGLQRSCCFHRRKASASCCAAPCRSSATMSSFNGAAVSHRRRVVAAQHVLVPARARASTELRFRTAGEVNPSSPAASTPVRPLQRSCGFTPQESWRWGSLLGTIRPEKLQRSCGFTPQERGAAAGRPSFSWPLLQRSCGFTPQESGPDPNRWTGWLA